MNRGGNRKYDVSASAAVGLLKSFFETSREDVVVIQGFSPVSTFVFDFDGVIVRECGIVEIGYAWLVRAVRDGIMDSSDLDVSQADVALVKEFRPTIKGKTWLEKVEAFRRGFGGSRPVACSDLELVDKYVETSRAAVLRRFGAYPRDYLLPGAVDFLEAARKTGRVFGLTANVQDQGAWLMDFVGLSCCFDEIVGFRRDAVSGATKGKLLADLLRRHGIDPSLAVYIGDGVPDMKAADAAGAVAAGIANGFDNGRKLIKAGCALLATSSRAGVDVIKKLREGGRPAGSFFMDEKKRSVDVIPREEVS